MAYRFWRDFLMYLMHWNLRLHSFGFYAKLKHKTLFRHVYLFQNGLTYLLTPKGLQLFSIEGWI